MILDFRNTVPDLSFNGLCNWLSKNLVLNKCNLVEICGDVCSGRTTCLLNIYQEWAKINSDLNKRFFFLLPLIRQEELSDFYKLDNRVSIPQEDASIEDRICQSLEKWAPNCCKAYGRENLLNQINSLEKDSILALIDQCDGHFTCSSSWSGLCIHTAFSTSDGPIAKEDAVKVYHAKLQPLSENVVRGNLKKYYCDDELSNHLKKFGSLLKNPHYLMIFQSIISKSTDKFDLNYLFMKKIIDDGNKWLERKSRKTCVGGFPGNYCCENELLYSAFSGVLTNNSSVSQNCKCTDNINIHFEGICCQKATPPYLICHKQNCLQFQDRNIMNLLAASHVIKKPQIAAWDWLRTPPAYFENVFLFVVQKLVDEQKVDLYTNVLQNYLSVYLKLYIPKREIKMHVEYSENCTLKDVGYGRNTETFAIFSKCSFLTKIDDICRGNPKIMNILKNILCEFTIWSIEWNSIKPNLHRFLKNIFLEIKKEHLSNPTCCKLKEFKLVGRISEPFNFHLAAELLSLLPSLECEVKVCTIFMPFKS